MFLEFILIFFRILYEIEIFYRDDIVFFVIKIHFLMLFSVLTFNIVTEGVTFPKPLAEARVGAFLHLDVPLNPRCGHC